MFRETLFLRMWALAKVPLISYVKPTVLEADDRHCVIRIRLRHRTKNHLSSMYFGALCIGVDVAGGFLAVRFIEREKANIALIFKEFRATFLKRAEGDVLFTCEDGEAIEALVAKASASGEREELPVTVTATAPSKLGGEPVAVFNLTLSIKKRG
jgi:acyl-coenzyme A thioesterase PaaI-like protein